MEELAPSEEIRFFLGGEEAILGTLLKWGVVCDNDFDKLDKLWVNIITPLFDRQSLLNLESAHEYASPGVKQKCGMQGNVHPLYSG